MWRIRKVEPSRVRNEYPSFPAPISGWREPGVYSEVWDGRGDDGIELPSGVYFYRLEASDVLEAGYFVATDKMALLR
jgi:hypothetical protein